jgi:hypothetical protein
MSPTLAPVKFEKRIDGEFVDDSSRQPLLLKLGGIACAHSATASRST